VSVDLTGKKALVTAGRAGSGAPSRRRGRRRPPTWSRATAGWEHIDALTAAGRDRREHIWSGRTCHDPARSTRSSRSAAALRH